jgi:DNA-binding NarL/FixJ family response regulator
MLFLAPVLARAKESAAAALGATRFEADFEAGRGLDRDTALGLALGKPAHIAAAAPADADAGLLAKRETDVARLIADGLTNKQIGTRLFISERTVDSHVRSILNKLGINSRAQIAAWMASSGQKEPPK